RGLSTRDIGDALQELGGEGVCLLSHASVSRLSEQLWEEYEAFSERDLSVLTWCTCLPTACTSLCGSRQGCSRRFSLPGPFCGTGARYCCTRAWGAKTANGTGWSTSAVWCCGVCARR